MPLPTRLIKLFTAASLALLACGVSAGEYPQWRLSQDHQPAAHNEYLLYRLAYSGIFTAFLWKDLADVALVTGPDNDRRLQQVNSCEITLKLTTENYALAESLRPTRYTWRSIIAPDLSRTYLIEERDEGAEAELNASWLDWQNDSIDLYRMRKKIPVGGNTGFFEDENSAILAWEQDGAKPPPPALSHYPMLDNKYTYLVYDKTVVLPETERLIDPLTLLYAARWNDYQSQPEIVLPISYEDEIRYYKARLTGHETLHIGSTDVPTLKIDIQRTDRQTSKEEGFLIMWVSDDERRIPLQFDIKAKVGKLRVFAREQSLGEQSSADSCLSRKPANSTIANQSQPAG